MPTFFTQTHSNTIKLNEPPPAVVGTDPHKVEAQDVPADARIGTPLLNVTRCDALCDVKLEEIDKSRFGPQWVRVSWRLGPAPGSTVSYELTVPVVKVPTGYGRVLLFEHAHFEGRMVEVWEAARSLGDLGFNDQVSSIVVLSGTWVFYKHADFVAPYALYDSAVRLTRGMYPWVGDCGIENDNVSSVRSLRE